MAKFLLMVNYDGGDIDTLMDEWDPSHVSAHMNHYEALNKELTESSELVGLTGLADARRARIVKSDGTSAPVVTDGPFPESKEVLAGFQVVDVESEARAIEIAAKVSAVPGPGGVLIRQPIEVRQVMANAGEEL